METVLLRNHLKNFTVKELKKEVVAVKKGFQVSKLRRAQVEAVILSYPSLFKHLLNKNPKIKKIKKVPLLTYEPKKTKAKKSRAKKPKFISNINKLIENYNKGKPGPNELERYLKAL